MEFDVDAQNTLTMVQCSLEYDIICPDIYGSLIEANRYFDNRLRHQYWTESCNDDKKRALTEATNIIDSLNYAGLKADANQLHQFPRATTPANFPEKVVSVVDLTVPKEVEMACYEVAIQLLSGVDPDLEIENLANVSQGFSQARITYDRAFILEHIAAGVPSARAWKLLKPYLRDPRNIKLSRVN